MEIHPIRTKKDYRAALSEVSVLVDLDPSPRSPEGERLEVLATLVEAYEKKHFPIGAPDPIEVTTFSGGTSAMQVRTTKSLDI